MKSEKAREIIDFGMMASGDGYISESSAVKAVETAEKELCDKFREDIHRFAEKWRDSDKKIDAIHISEMNELQAETATLRTALDEANKRCEIAQKVIEQKNREPRGSQSTAARLKTPEEEYIEALKPILKDIGFHTALSMAENEQREAQKLTLNDYQIRAMGTCLPESRNPMYMLFGLSEEVGELCGKFAKAIRKGEIVITDNGIEYTDKCDKKAFIEAVQKEGGDCFWMLFGFCSVMGWAADSIANGNLSKLAARKESNTIVSHTDH